MSREDHQMKIRIPADMKEKLEAAANSNKRSMNAEVILRLRQTLSVDEGLKNAEKFMNELADSYPEGHRLADYKTATADPKARASIAEQLHKVAERIKSNEEKMKEYEMKMREIEEALSLPENAREKNERDIIALSAIRQKDRKDK